MKTTALWMIGVLAVTTSWGCASTPDKPPGLPVIINDKPIANDKPMPPGDGKFRRKPVVRPRGMSLEQYEALKKKEAEAEAARKAKEAEEARKIADLNAVDPRCGTQRIVGAKPLLVAGAFIVLGDQYGSNEIPAFAGSLVCEAATSGVTTHLMLEIPRVEQKVLDRYLASEGTDEDRARMLNGGMWHRMYEDGRSSAAVLELIERMRVLRNSGLPIHVHYYDELLGQYRDHGTAKEQAVARNLVTLRAQAPSDLYIVLTGNVHARTAETVPWDSTFKPMGHWLAKEIPGMITLDADYQGGEVWSCRKSQLGYRIKCGPRPVIQPIYRIRDDDFPLTPEGQKLTRFIGHWPKPTPEGFHGVYHVGSLTPSQPAAKQYASSR